MIRKTSDKVIQNMHVENLPFFVKGNNSEVAEAIRVVINLGQDIMHINIFMKIEQQLLTWRANIARTPPWCIQQAYKFKNHK